MSYKKSFFLLQQGPEVRLPLGQGIAGHVASTGKISEQVVVD